MASHTSPAGALPAGWTYHALNGRPFYYHAATNTTRSDPPNMTGSFEMNQIAYDAPQYPEPASEPQPPPTSNSELQGQLQAMCSAAQAQPRAPQQAVVVPAAVVAYAAATSPYATATSPRVEAPMPLPPALQLQPGIYSAAQVPAPVPMFAAPAPAPVPMFAAPVAQAQAHQMAQLQVLVPEPGLRAGQQLAFTAPAAGPGLQPLPMTVTVNQEVVAGSIVSVQYPRPQMLAQPVVGRSLPATTIHVDPAEDQRQSSILWALYGAGCCCAFIFGPFAFILWVVGCSVHFCKPAETRAQYPRARTPAMFAATTCLLFLCCGLLMIPFAMLSGPHHGGPWHHHHGHGHDDDGPWLGSASSGHEDHHHPPCPFKGLKKWFKVQFGSQRQAMTKSMTSSVQVDDQGPLVAMKENDIAKWVESPHSQGPLMAMDESRVMPPRPQGPLKSSDIVKWLTTKLESPRPQGPLPASDITKWLESPRPQGPLPALKSGDIAKWVESPRPQGPLPALKNSDIAKWVESPRPQPPLMAGQYIVL